VGVEGQRGLVDLACGVNSTRSIRSNSTSMMNFS
jgi:hypothetical protein